MDTPPPFEPPPIRALRRVWKDYLEEIATTQDVATVIQAVSDLATAQLESLHAQAEHGISHPDDPAYKHTVQCFTEMLEAVEVMFGELDEPGQGYFEGGFEMAEKAARKMLEGHQRIVETVEQMGNVSCIFCS
ncbi:unnamed protein product, partial [Phaeothamnion confervicola]